MSVDPLAEQFPGWTPYHYVHNNPVNLIDPTRMSAENYDPPTEGNFANGTVHTDDSGSWTYKDGIWEDNSGGGNNFGEEVFIDARGNHSDSYSGNTIECVKCHHTTVFGSGEPNNSPYDRYTIWGYNRTGGGNEKSMRGQNVNAISFNITDVPLMGAGGASLNSIGTVSQLGKILQHWVSGASGGVALGENPNIKNTVNTQRIDYSSTKRDARNNAVLHTPYARDTVVEKGMKILLEEIIQMIL